MSCTMKIIINVISFRRSMVWFFGLKEGWNILETSVNLTRRIKKIIHIKLWILNCKILIIINTKDNGSTIFVVNTS